MKEVTNLLKKKKTHTNILGHCKVKNLQKKKSHRFT